MRARSKNAMSDTGARSYVQFDGDATPIGSGSSFFAFETIFRDWLDVRFARAFEARVADAQLDSGIATIASAGARGVTVAGLAADSDPAVVASSADGGFFLPAVHDKVLVDDVLTASDDRLIGAAIVAETSAPSTPAAEAAYVPFATSSIDFSLYPEFETVPSLLSLTNLGPIAALNQTDRVFFIEDGLASTFVRFATAESGSMLSGRDAFDPTVYMISDIDGDGVQDFVVRMDEKGPVLVGTDFLG